MAINNSISRPAGLQPSVWHNRQLGSSIRKNCESGAALLTVLVMVLILLIGAIAVFVSTESTALLAGNMAFREATKQAADIGVNEANTYLTSYTALDTAVSNKYFPLKQTDDSNGLPSTVSWDSVSTTTVGNYEMKYVIERLCTGSLPADTSTQCMLLPGSDTGGSKGVNSTSTTTSASVLYRVTIRTQGPKNAEAYTQVLIAK